MCTSFAYDFSYFLVAGLVIICLWIGGGGWETWGAGSCGFQGELSQEEILVHGGIPHASEWTLYAQIRINETFV